jgi:hypothetical protein
VFAAKAELWRHAQAQQVVKYDQLVRHQAYWRRKSSLSLNGDDGDDHEVRYALGDHL